MFNNKSKVNEVVFKGGIGNLLFQFSFFLTLAKYIKGLKIDLNSPLSTGLPQFSRFKEIISDYPTEIKLNNTHGIDKNKKSRYLRLLNEKLLFLRIFKENQFEKLNFSIINNNKNIYIGYWHNYFDYVKDNLSYIEGKIFEINLTEATKVKVSLIKENDIAIHIRKGDFLSKKNLNVYCNLKKEYFLKAVEHIEKEIKINTITIFSNDKNLNLEDYNFNYPTKLFNGQCDDLEELVLISKYQNLVISNSTYSLWAGYLNYSNKNNLIAPENWYINGDENTNTSKFFDKKWVRI